MGLDTVELVMEIEEAFDISIPEDMHNDSRPREESRRVKLQKACISLLQHCQTRQMWIRSSCSCHVSDGCGLLRRNNIANRHSQ